MTARRHTRARLGAGACLAGLACLAGAVAGPATALASPTIGGFGVAPAHPDPHVRASRAYFVINARRGSTSRQTATVTNHGSAPLRLTVGSVDGLTGVTSGVVYGSRRTARGPSSWLRLPGGHVTVPARGTAQVRFTVRVPRSTTPGDHLAGVSFQTPHPKLTGRHVAVRVVVRTVIGVQVIVRGPARPRMRLSGVSLGQLPGTTVPAAMVTMGDAGRRLCRPRLAVTVRGASSRTTTETLGTILPGDTIRFPLQWPGTLARGRYAVTARTSRCGPVTSVSAISVYPPRRATAHHPGRVGALAPLAGVGSGGDGWWPYALIAAGIAAVAGFVAMLRRHGPHWHGVGSQARR